MLVNDPARGQRQLDARHHRGETGQTGADVHTVVLRLDRPGGVKVADLQADQIDGVVRLQRVGSRRKSDKGQCGQQQRYTGSSSAVRSKNTHCCFTMLML